MHDWNRSSPVALTRDQPVAKPKILCLFAKSFGSQHFGDLGDSCSFLQAVELS